MKKLLSLLTALVLLATMALPVTAQNAVIHPQVLHSITEESATGLGLAFHFTVNASDVAVSGTCDFAGGTVSHNGTQVALVKMGAVVTNWAVTGTNESAMVLENVNGEKIIDIEAAKLLSWDADSCAFAVRVIQIPQSQRATTIYARPYYMVEDAQGNRETVYGSIDSNSYFGQWCSLQPAVALPAVGTDIDVVNGKNRIRVSAANIENRTVTLTFQNYTTNWITEETNWVEYTCYGADGSVVQKATRIYIGCIDTKKNKIKHFTFDVPDATAKVRLTGSSIIYWTEWA